MKELKLSPNFTVEDIRKVREYNHKHRKNILTDELMEDIQKGANETLKRIGKPLLKPQ
jgi:hypothetical protein